jgi:hypothetical protein
VLHANRAIEAARERDPAFQAKLDALARDIQAQT